MLPFTLHLQNGLPVSDQVFQAVRKAILTGQLKDGESFPSVRTISQELRISPTTVHKVVAQLKDDGFLGARPGVGMVVTLPQIDSKADRIRHLLPQCQRLLAEARELHLDLSDVQAALRLAAK
jgi:GntR family transcriptional regulator